MITLVRPQAADGPHLIAANRANADYHAPWTQPFTDQDGFDRWRAGHGERAVGLIARAGSGIVGVINFTEIVRGAFQSAYCGFYGMRDFAGRGLMTAALRAAVQFAFADLGLHRLEANIQPGNARSIALVQRVGFRKEGLSPNYLKIDGAWRDHERWAITEED